MAIDDYDCASGLDTIAYPPLGEGGDRCNTTGKAQAIQDIKGMRKHPRLATPAIAFFSHFEDELAELPEKSFMAIPLDISLPEDSRRTGGRSKKKHGKPPTHGKPSFLKLIHNVCRRDANSVGQPAFTVEAPPPTERQVQPGPDEYGQDDMKLHQTQQSS